MPRQTALGEKRDARERDPQREQPVGCSRGVDAHGIGARCARRPDIRACRSIRIEREREKRGRVTIGGEVQTRERG